MAQTWKDLLFAHWPMPPADVRPLLPDGLELDTFDGRAWLAVTPFVLDKLRPRALPPLPGLSRFPELNVRTYARAGGKSGVFFFSLDAGSTLAVAAARAFYALPYFRAAFAVSTREGWIRYRARRLRPGPPAACDVSYRPTGPARRAPADDLAAWLTERYCLYAVSGARLYRAEIQHPPWPLQPAEAEFRRNTMTAWLGLRLPDTPPLLHFAQRLDVRVWAPHAVDAR